MKAYSTFLDYRGNIQPTPKPSKGTLLHVDGEIALYKTGKTFAVVYGLSMREGLHYFDAAKEFGNALMHRLTYNGKIEP